MTLIAKQDTSVDPRQKAQAPAAAAAAAPYYKKQAKYHDKRTTTNKAHLVDTIIRHRILDSIFYKQHLYLANEATILQVITKHVHYIGGVDSMGRPSPFIQCLFRLLELNPSKEIVHVYLHQLEFNEFKYLLALSLLFVRLTYPSEEVYSIFDEFAQDYRKLRYKMKVPDFDENKLAIFYKIGYMDEFLDDLLMKERVVDLLLPRLTLRNTLVEQALAVPRKYYVDETLAKQEDDLPSEDDEIEGADEKEKDEKEIEEGIMY